MKKLLILLALCSASAIAAAPTILAVTFAGNGGSNFFNTSLMIPAAPIDSTGATALLVYLEANIDHACTLSINDSKSNTWAAATAESANGNTTGCWFRATNVPLVLGTGHNFGSSSSSNGSMFVLAIGGSAASPIDQVAVYSGTAGNTTPLQFGAVTPTQANELVISVIGENHPNSDNFAVDSGFAFAYDQGQDSTHYSGVVAYLAQTTATTVNPTWQHNDGFGLGVVGHNITLKAAGAGASAAAKRRIL